MPEEDVIMPYNEANSEAIKRYLESLPRCYEAPFPPELPIDDGTEKGSVELCSQCRHKRFCSNAVTSKED